MVGLPCYTNNLKCQMTFLSRVQFLIECFVFLHLDFCLSICRYVCVCFNFSQRPILGCVCVFIETGAQTQNLVDGFFQHIFTTWDCFRSAECEEGENILYLHFLFFCLLFHLSLSIFPVARKYGCCQR